MSVTNETPARPRPAEGAVVRLACLALQPVLLRVIRRIAARHPALFSRLGPRQFTDFLSDPMELPFALHLRPDPQVLVLHAVPRAGATIRGRFLLLLELIAADKDDDVAFFLRNVEATGEIEAVVRLRNALDDMGGALAQNTAAMFGPAAALRTAMDARADAVDCWFQDATNARKFPAAERPPRRSGRGGGLCRSAPHEGAAGSEHPRLDALSGAAGLSNGFYHGATGYRRPAMAAPT